MIRTRTKKLNKKLLNRKTKKLAPFILWAVIDNEFPDDPITFASTHEEAQEALDQYLYIRNYEHFRLWCENHDVPVDHAFNWNQYCELSLIPSMVVDPANPPYVIAKVSYQPNVIASLFRMFNHCIPLGCTFDTQEELEQQAYRLAANEIKAEKGIATDDTADPATVSTLREPFATIERNLAIIMKDLDLPSDAELTEDLLPPPNPYLADTSTDTDDNNTSTRNKTTKTKRKSVRAKKKAPSNPNHFDA